LPALLGRVLAATKASLPKGWPAARLGYTESKVNKHAMCARWGILRVDAWAARYPPTHYHYGVKVQGAIQMAHVNTWTSGLRLSCTPFHTQVQAYCVAQPPTHPNCAVARALSRMTWTTSPPCSYEGFPTRRSAPDGATFGTKPQTPPSLALGQRTGLTSTS